MNPAIVSAIIAAVPGIITIIIALINRRRINELHVIVNGRLNELLALTAKASKAEGFKEATDNRQ
jgi:hypothetical protein